MQPVSGELIKNEGLGPDHVEAISQLRRNYLEPSEIGIVTPWAEEEMLLNSSVSGELLETKDTELFEEGNPETPQEQVVPIGPEDWFANMHNVLLLHKLRRARLELLDKE